MLRKLLRILGFLIGCGVVCTYIWYASSLAQQHRAKQRVTEVIISMPDSTETQTFASSQQIRKQLQRKGLHIKDREIDSVDAVTISDYIMRNGFVRDANVYVTYSGTVHIDVRQHKPVVRLLCGGMNSYITQNGEVFRSPKSAAYYTAVVSGKYKPPFAANYEGGITTQRSSAVEHENAKLTKLGDEFTSLEEELNRVRNRRSELRKKSKKSLFESEDNHEQRKVGIASELAKCDVQLKQLAVCKDRLEERERGIRERKKKLEKKYDDFANLINFVTRVEEDSFWCAEVVQFVADTTSTGEISLRLVPRSGSFIIEFGTLDKSEEKLEKLQTFYDKGLSHIGWDRYKVIDVRYNRQVICTE